MGKNGPEKLFKYRILSLALVRYKVLRIKSLERKKDVYKHISLFLNIREQRNTADLKSLYRIELWMWFLVNGNDSTQRHRKPITC